LTISLLQVAAFAYNSLVVVDNSDVDEIGCSSAIFHPFKRSEVWRYVTYMFVHSGLFHLAFNILAQLALGIPLEMVHGLSPVLSITLRPVYQGCQMVCFQTKNPKFG
jgi:rhomboid-related protein 1/2/3